MGSRNVDREREREIERKRSSCKARNKTHKPPTERCLLLGRDSREKDRATRYKGHGSTQNMWLLARAQ